MSCRRRGYLAGGLAYGRIQVFLDSHPEKSGFKGFPDLLISISGKPLVSRTCRSASRGNHWFAGLADRHLGETTGFPDLLISISGKPLVSRTCWSASRGNHCLPGLANQHLGEAGGFPDMLFHVEFFAARREIFRVEI